VREPKPSGESAYRGLEESSPARTSAHLGSNQGKVLPVFDQRLPRSWELAAQDKSGSEGASLALREGILEWPSSHDRLVVNLDADLYSSTAFVLSQLQPRLPIGSRIYFDEFNHRADELRAFDEFLEETNFTFVSSRRRTSLRTLRLSGSRSRLVGSIYRDAGGSTHPRCRT
jgi:hypothetical protein